MKRFPKKFDLIISNPPWITSSKLSISDTLENAVYDSKG
jgi:methylase of polypeptide subunit release factors